MNDRPLSISIIGWLFIALGSFVILVNVLWLAHGPGLAAGHLPGVGEHGDLIWVFVTEVLAIVAGVFLLRGRNWARWLLVAWVAFHVALSMFHEWGELAVHAALFVVVIFFLFRPAAGDFFRGGTGTVAE